MTVEMFGFNVGNCHSKYEDIVMSSGSVKMKGPEKVTHYTHRWATRHCISVPFSAVSPVSGTPRFWKRFKEQVEKTGEWNRRIFCVCHSTQRPGDRRRCYDTASSPRIKAKTSRAEYLLYCRAWMCETLIAALSESVSVVSPVSRTPRFWKRG